MDLERPAGRQTCCAGFDGGRPCRRPCVDPASRLELGAEALKLCLQIAVAMIAASLFLTALFVRQIVEDRRQIGESEQRFRRAMEDSAIGVAIVGLDGRILQTNPAFATMLGYSREEIEALTFFQITHPDDLQIGKDTMISLKEGKIDAFHFEKRYLRKDGTPVWAQLPARSSATKTTAVRSTWFHRLRTSTPASSPRPASRKPKRAGTLRWPALVRASGISTCARAARPTPVPG
ncbi:hypothetical protein AJ88_44195 [Mesorhizobium amorphae CCBAU 01583]|nr:hypothetical protein AJ88_44195 [Mesorhizobium amorphae CCBAU 01583]